MKILPDRSMEMHWGLLNAPVCPGAFTKAAPSVPATVETTYFFEEGVLEESGGKIEWVFDTLLIAFLSENANNEIVKAIAITQGNIPALLEWLIGQ
jgi:hypothetical protein